jgi:hypothetical protein
MLLLHVVISCCSSLFCIDISSLFAQLHHLGENGGKIAAKVLSPDEAQFALKVFGGAREEVLEKLKQLNAIQVGNRM